jgi:hypothetical protein
MISAMAATAAALTAIIVVVPGPTPAPQPSTGVGGGLAGASAGGGSALPRRSAGSAGQSAPAGLPGAPGLNPGPCTIQVSSSSTLAQALSGASGGQRICVTTNLAASRLTITKGGASPSQPVTVLGTGQTVVKGITVKANNVTVAGFQVLDASAPGIEITGNNITVANNTVTHPTGGDYDGMRFFGSHLSIVHNTITDISPDGSGAHADCMQTFTSGGGPPSEHVLINGNRCDNIDNQCLMAEGPGDVGDGGGGPGKSDDWTLSNNYCKFNASQALMIEAVQNVTIRNNAFVGKADKAIGLDINSTGAKVAANKLIGIKAAVGMSENSKAGYQGPQPQGGP